VTTVEMGDFAKFALVQNAVSAKLLNE